ncbi:A-kinase anchor protein 4 isoform X2 [Heterocephalus glaber]|uniref:A-kinase anchor protein 4 isoform X2 n=1 Tax=Heterocephalus glaber TaxID=10181 RepID=A0AAX6SC98_HETGA|nr:A-kinase anchor protein 4 isoform X2 [Heterocephalus glaber]
MARMMSDIDWLHSCRGVCKVDLYSPIRQQDQERKVICFVDVSNLNAEDKDSKGATGSSSEFNFNLQTLEDKEIVVIKDTEKKDQSKIEGSVCLFKQAPFDPLVVLHWLLIDLQKHALGFQHALSPSASSCKHKAGDIDDYHKTGNCYSVYADKLSIDHTAKGPQCLHLEMTATKNTNNNQSPSTPVVKSSNTQKEVKSPDGECSMDDLSYYVNQLSSLVIQMACKEIKEKLESGSKGLHHSVYQPTGEKGKNSPHSPLSKIASEMAHEEVELTSSEMCGTGEENQEGGQKTFLYSELSNKSKCGEKQMFQRDSKEFADSISKGLMVYANQEASDMIVSVMKTLKVHSSGKPIPACVVLKRVLLKHTKEIMSDLFDSCMKNLHNITRVLMTDSDFVSAVKSNLFNRGKQNAADLMEAMLNRLVSALLSEKETESQSLSYATLKTGSQDPKCKNQSLEFSSMKAEMKGKDKSKMKSDQCKSLTSAEKVSEHILKESLTMWNQKQGNPCKRATKLCANKDEKKENISPSMDSLAKDLIVSALRLIQYHLIQQAKGKDTLEEDCPGSSLGYVAPSTQYEKCGGCQSTRTLSVKHLESRGTPGPSTSLKENQQLDCQKLDMSNIVLSLIQKLLSESPFSCDKLCEGENKSSEPRTNKASSMARRPDREVQCQDNAELDSISGMKQMNHQFIDQLVESVMKLCMIMANCSNNREAFAELEEREAGLTNNAGSSRHGQETTVLKNQDYPGPEVIVNNQCSTSNLQKQLQAVLQWIAASEFNVPMLYFMGDDDGQLEKLPEVSAKAAEKGYSVGDLLQEVMRFAKEQQLDEAVVNMPKKQLLDWLLTNLIPSQLEPPLPSCW